MALHLNHAITAAGFWLGTLLVLVGLLSVHALALIVGHEYPGSRP